MDLLPMHAWHPVAIHLPLVAFLLAAFFDLVGSFRRQARWRDAATPLWWLGIAGAAAAVATGLLAYNRVDHSDPSHELMTLHRNLALASLAVLLGAAAWRWRRALSRPAAVLGVVGALGLGGVGYLGGELVYRHGLGIPSDRLHRVLLERGVEDRMMADSTALKPPSEDSTAGMDSTRHAAGAKKGHTHPPGKEH